MITRVRLAASVVLVALAAACAAPAAVPLPTIATPSTATTIAASATPSAKPGAASSAEAALAKLPVKGRAPMTGFTRDQFGKGWGDPDGNGCDARRDALDRQAVGVPVRAGAHHCILTATILDPYTGEEIPSTGADIDHVVALGDAWAKGAQALPAKAPKGVISREAMASDPLELLAVVAHENRSKGDADAASYLPPQSRCPYVARQVAVKVKYRLWVTSAERDAMVRVLRTCPGELLPT